MLFKRFRRFIRARARRQLKLRDIERKQQAEWARREFEWRQRIEAEKDEAFENLCSAFKIGQIGFQPDDGALIRLRNCLLLTGWRYTPVAERMAAE